MSAQRLPLVATAALLMGLSVAAADARRLAPSLTLTDARDAPVQLADLRGRVVLVDFFASWCIPCRKSFPHVEALYQELHERGLTVLAVNVDERRKQADQFLQSFHYTMPVVFDPEGKAAQAFELKAMPSTVIVDRRGFIRFIHMGYTEHTLAQYRNEVLSLLGEPQ